MCLDNRSMDLMELRRPWKAQISPRRMPAQSTQLPQPWESRSQTARRINPARGNATEKPSWVSHTSRLRSFIAPYLPHYYLYYSTLQYPKKQDVWSNYLDNSPVQAIIPGCRPKFRIRSMSILPIGGKYSKMDKNMRKPQEGGQTEIDRRIGNYSGRDQCGRISEL